MREYMLSFVSDDINKMTVFDALHSAGLRNFVVTETQICNYENWKKDCAENAQTQTCGNCKYDCDGCCRFEYIRHDSDHTCEKFEPTVAENATTTKQKTDWCIKCVHCMDIGDVLEDGRCAWYCAYHYGEPRLGKCSHYQEKCSNCNMAKNLGSCSEICEYYYDNLRNKKRKTKQIELVEE